MKPVTVTNMISEILLLNYLRITAVVSFYWIVSILTVFVNKTLLSSIELDAPLFVLWFQCFVSVLICLLMKIFTAYFPGTVSFPDGSPFTYQIAKKIIPLSILFTLMIGFNMLCLKYVGVSFYFIGRSLTTVFNVLLTFLVLKEVISRKVLACCFAIVMGFLMGIDQESMSGTLSFDGTVYGVLSSLMLAFYSILIKKVLPSLNNNVWLLSYYNNVYATLILIPVIFFSGDLHSVFNFTKLSDSHFWFLMCIGGVCGFAIGYATSLQIKVTSPLTHNISGTAKACAQTVIATYWYSEHKSWIWWISNWIVLFGSACYTHVRQREMQENLIRSRTIPTV